MQLLKSSTLAIIPYINNPLTWVSLPTKLFEYIKLSKTVICPNLPGFAEVLGYDNPGLYDINDRLSLLRCSLFFEQHFKGYSNEKLIIDTMNKIKKELILIIIAHKISVLENADKILIIKRGLKIDEGTYDDLFLSNKEFNRLFKKSIIP